tara:strand:- start:1822 stop:2151 length:330 start_codon:yes stop_codon:yes gene_type:complete
MWKDILKGPSEATQFVLGFLQVKLDRLKVEIQGQVNLMANFKLDSLKMKAAIRESHKETMENYKDFLIRDNLFMGAFEARGHGLVEVDWEEILSVYMKKLNEIIDEVVV